MTWRSRGFRRQIWALPGSGGAATHLQFDTQPVGGVSGQPLTTQPVVSARRADGTIDTNYTGTVLFTLNTVSGDPVLSEN